MWKAILALIQALPTLLKWAQKGYEALVEWLERRDREAKSKRLRSAIEKARSTRDQRAIEEHFGRKHPKKKSGSKHAVRDSSGRFAPKP